MTIKKKTMESVYWVIGQNIKAKKDKDYIHDLLRTLFPKIRISNNRFNLWYKVANRMVDEDG